MLPNLDIYMNNSISRIIENVRKNGDKAIIFYTNKFDKVRLTASRFRVTSAEIESAIKKVKPDVKKALLNAAANIRRFHRAEAARVAKTWFNRDKGCITGQIIKPVEKAGIYIPGGKYAFYPSIVLMTAIPARIAGVKKVVMVTPPGNIRPEVLFAAKLAQVDEIYRVGGPQSIAGLAFGTKTLPRVDLIAGPGSSYVTEAKRQLFGQVGLDMLAGPSEVAIICDAFAPVKYIVDDLLAQAEHSPETKVYLLCDSRSHTVKIKTELGKAIAEKKREIPHLSAGRQFLIKYASISDCIEEINKIAPEHLQIMHRQSKKILKSIKNAGAIFMGAFSPVAAGDYYAGPSHVLPTGGTARFFSGLSVQTFLKRTSYIQYSRSALIESSADIAAIANSEKLVMHGESVLVRG